MQKAFILIILQNLISSFMEKISSSSLDFSDKSSQIPSRLRILSISFYKEHNSLE